MTGRNITHINQIEGLISQVHEHLKGIEPETDKQGSLQLRAIEGLSSYEIKQLRALRKGYE